MDRLITNFPYNLNGNFRRYIVENTYSINKNFLEVLNIINNHKNKNVFQHYSKQIEHNSQNLHKVLNRLEGRINNQIYGEEYEGMNEVVDARVDIDGYRHDNLQSRLNKSFETIEKIQQKNNEISIENKEKINSNNYYNNLKRLKGRKFETTYNIIEIPEKDEKGNLIKLKRGIKGHNPNKPEKTTVRDFANEVNATVAINASTFVESKNMMNGQQIFNDEILESIKQDENKPVKNHWSFAFDEHNNFNSFPQHISAKEIKEKGYNNSLSGFGPLILEGKTVYSEGDYASNGTEKNPRSVIGKLDNNNIFFFTCDGRVEANGTTEKGMTLSEVIDVLYDVYGNIKFAYVLDGGGSTSLYYQGTTINKTTDGSNRYEREIYDILYISKEKQSLTQKDKDIKNTNELLGELRADWQFLYGLFVNLNKLNSSVFGLTKYDENTGLFFNDKDEAKKKIYVNDKGFRFYDYELNQTVFIIDAKEDTIQFKNKELARNYSNPEEVKNANDIKIGGSYYLSTNTKNSPFMNASSGIIIQYNLTKSYFDNGDDASIMQLAYPYSKNNNIRAMRRIYDGKNGWSDWIDL